MVGIVFLLNLEYAPYIKKYIDILNKEHKEFEVIYWDRLNREEYQHEYTTHVYKKQSELNKSKYEKAYDFIGFRRFAIEKIKNRGYDKLIVLTTLTGFLLADILMKDYKGKYIFDIRDYSFEKNIIFKKIESKIINKSSFTSISSEGFRAFLPESNKYIISHNILRNELSEAKKCITKINKNKKIDVTFIGSVRHLDMDIKFAQTLGKDRRFNLTYHGDGPKYNEFLSYCKDKDLNVNLTGRYNRSDKSKLLEEASIINSYYDSNEYINKFAVSNKFYDSLIYKIPLLVSSQTYIGDITEKYKLGITLDINKCNIGDEIYKQFNSINFEEFSDNCELLLEEIVRQDDMFIDKVKEFIND